VQLSQHTCINILKTLEQWYSHKYTMMNEVLMKGVILYLLRPVMNKMHKGPSVLECSAILRNNSNWSLCVREELILTTRVTRGCQTTRMANRWQVGGKTPSPCVYDFLRYMYSELSFSPSRTIPYPVFLPPRTIPFTSFCHPDNSLHVFLPPG